MPIDATARVEALFKVMTIISSGSEVKRVDYAAPPPHARHLGILRFKEVFACRCPRRVASAGGKAAMRA